MTIKRKRELSELKGLLQRHRVVGLLGARQVGKTTLARDYIRNLLGIAHVFDLENPEDYARLADPMIALKDLKGIIVIDEIQRHPDLFKVLRVLTDRSPNPARFLILGSASPELLKQSSETLAGRIFYHELNGFSIEEAGSANLEKLWLRGGLPRSFLAKSELESFEWRTGYIRTFLEKDLPQLGVHVSAHTMRRFWTMLAHYHGQIWNTSEFARSFGVSDTTVRSYLDHLSSALVVRQLQPWHENISKRQVKAPKVYVGDSGIMHALLNLREKDDIESHPKLGASWEGFVLDQVIRIIGAVSGECYFWATHNGAELDLLIVRGAKKYGFEIKRTSAPAITPSMRHSLADLHLTSLDIIHAGDKTFQLSEKIRAVSVHRLFQDITLSV